MSLGLLETSFLSITALACDAALKAGDVRLLGLEPVGSEAVLSRFSGSPGDLSAAFQAAEARVKAMGSEVVASRILAAPAAGLEGACVGNDSINPLYGGREFFLPAAQLHSKQPMNPQAIGILETQGLTAILNATDAMLKSASVELVGKEKIGAAYVTIIVKGDVAAVTAAIQAGREAIGGLGKLIAAHVIARPHQDLLALLPK